MQQKVLRFRLTPQKAQEIVREAAASANERIFITPHALRRMRERKISRKQVIECLAKGKVIEDPVLSLKGNWEFSMKWICAGQQVTTVLAIESLATQPIIVITVYH